MRVDQRRLQGSPTTIAELFQTPENLAIVSSPDRVEAGILYMKEAWFSKDVRKRKYKEGKPRPVPSGDAQLLSASLTDSKTYGWDYSKACMPTWNARVKFFRGDHYVSVDFCFGCDILLLGRDGQPFESEDFDGAADSIFEVVRSLFPDDRVVRDILKDKEQEKVWRLEKQQFIEREKKANSERSASP